MIIKKFQAETEQEAIMMAKEEMGSAAVVVNIKTLKHRGISRLFKKDSVEVTAALEEIQHTAPLPTKAVNLSIDDNYKVGYNNYKMNANMEQTNVIEEKLNNLQTILEQRMKSADEKKDDDKKEDSDLSPEAKDDKNEETVSLKFIKLVYNQLIDNEVDEKYANQIIGEIQSSMKKEASVDTILSAVYQKIILKIGQSKAITLKENEKKIAFFIGPTGVGKTTTIAKLASYFKLEKKLKVALITSDTYRIAAVEQLRTYAGILDVPLKVIYTIEELNQAIDDYKEFDLILVDTAGRSHKNEEQCKEVEHLIRDARIPEGIEKETYLVLSAATKYKDLIKINEAFGTVKDYSIIFTKLDETSCLGNVLNMRLRTDIPLSYVTSGQVVPDDIGILDPQKIARSLLGSNE